MARPGQTLELEEGRPSPSTPEGTWFRCTRCGEYA